MSQDHLKHRLEDLFSSSVELPAEEPSAVPQPAAPEPAGRDIRAQAAAADRPRDDADVARRAQLLAALTRVSQRLNRLADPAEILDQVYASMGEVLDNRNFSIALYDAANDYITFPIYTFDGERRPVEGRQMANGLTEYVIRAREPVFLPRDVMAGIQARGMQAIGKTAYSLMSVPMLAGDNVVGVITLQDYDQADVYTPDHLDLLTIVAAQAAVAIENARLYAALHQQLEHDAKLLGDLTKFRRGLEHSSDAVFITDMQGTILYANPAFEKVYGYAVAEALGQTPRILKSGVIPQERYVEFWGALLAGQAVAGEIINKTKGGRLIPIEGSNTPIFDDAGKPLGFLAVHRDITERKQAEEAIKAEQQRTQTILETVTVPMIISRLSDSRVLYANQALAQIGHIALEELIGGRAVDYFANREDRQKVAEILQQRGYVSDFETQLRRGDGVTYWALLSARIINYQDETCVLSSYIDITERKRAEETQARRAVQLQTAAEVSRAVSLLLSPDELLSTVVDLVRERFDLYYVGVFLLDETRRRAVLRAATGEAGRAMIEAGHKLEIGGTSMIGRCVATGQARIALDVGDEAVRFDNPLLPFTRSEMALPLISRGQVVGAVSVQSARPADFSEEDVAILQTMADQVTIAISNAQLFEQTQQHVAELDTVNRINQSLTSQLELDDMIRLVVDQVRAVFEVEAAYVALYDRHRQMIEVPYMVELGRRVDIAPFPYGQGLTSRIIQTCQPLLINRDTERRSSELGAIQAGDAPARSYLGVPIMAGENVVGVIAIQNTQQEGLFGEYEQRLLTTIAPSLGIAIQNARLFKEARTHADELSVLNALAQTLTTRLDVNQVLDEIYRGVSRLLDTRNFYIGLYDPDRNTVSFPLNVTESEIDREITIIPADQGITGYVIRTRQPLLIQEDVRGWIEKLGMKPIGEIARSWLGLPLLIGDQVLGVMAVQSYTDALAYDEHDQELMTAFAGQAAIAIQNARLFEETQQRNAELAALNEIVRSVSQQIDLSEALETTYRHVRRLVPLDAFYIGLYDEAANLVHYPLLYDEDRRYDEAPRPLRPDTYLGRAMLNREPILHLLTPDELAATPTGGLGNVSRVPASVLCVPLQLGDRTIGAMSAQSYHLNAFTPQHLELMTTVANQVVTAIQNARLFEQTQTALADTRRLYDMSARLNTASTLDEVLSAAIAPGIEAGASSAGLWLVYPDAHDRPDEIEFAATWVREGDPVLPLGTRFRMTDFPSARILLEQQGQPVFVDDTASDGRLDDLARATFQQVGIQSTALIPLAIGQRLPGVIFISWNQPHAFTSQEQQRYVSIAAQAAVVLDNRRLFAQTQTSLAQTRALYDMNARLTTAVTMDDIAEAISQSDWVAGAGSVSLNLFEYDATGQPEWSVLVAARSAHDAPVMLPVGTRLYLPDFPMTQLWLADPSNPLLINDMALDDRADAMTRQLLTQAGMSAMAVLPLSYAGRHMGLVAITWSSPQTFHDDDYRLFTSIARQAAIAVNNRLLLEEITRKARHSQMINQITRKIRSAASVEEVLRVAADDLRQATRAARSAARLSAPAQDGNGHEPQR